ncbi:UDP-glucose 4-epimerase GalE [Tardiphaga sp. vice154]|uniref:UDP-glucose 4-epimerase GalE n=1 Tax=Tardiphaga sp. vice154 TaxID=2592814 RepID=UPI00116334F7|nr:UDP-glucose 4-epimerase GalE [Tardiphaga sp. vice154]QDM22619.1 UDP-glucose 4-epimerase GalE [Tardiphaga sp. vice154]
MTYKISILVTGGAGYIGSHCSKAAAEAGFMPICYDNLSTGHADFARWGPLIVGDIHDSGKLTSVIREHNVQAVMHFAAFSAVGESVVDPQKYYFNNVAGTLALLRGMRDAGCDKLVFSSTGAVYGNAGRDPIQESAAGQTVNPYGRSKWMVEQILTDYRAAYQFNSVCLRYFNACGADPSGSIGERRDPETHLIPRALMALQGHVSNFAIFGEDYDTPDGTAVRDYIHVNDLAAAHVAALQLLLNGGSGGAFNLGTGVGYSVRQIVDAVLAETGRSVPLVVRERRAGDPPILVADPAQSETALGFKATHSGLPDIIRSAWAWHQKAHPLREDIREAQA